ncbi:Histidinol-phosphate aminotransferase, partial [Bienertia sinuspersici]
APFHSHFLSFFLSHLTQSLKLNVLLQCSIVVAPHRLTGVTALLRSISNCHTSPQIYDLCSPLLRRPCSLSCTTSLLLAVIGKKDLVLDQPKIVIDEKIEVLGLTKVTSE